MIIKTVLVGARVGIRQGLVGKEVSVVSTLERVVEHDAVVV